MPALRTRRARHGRSAWPAARPRSASSRSSRQARRDIRPVRVDAEPEPGRTTRDDDRPGLLDARGHLHRAGAAQDLAPAAARRLGGRHRPGRRRPRRHVGRHREAVGAVRVPTRLRATADRPAGHDQPAVHRAGRHVLGRLPGRGLGLQGHHRRPRRDGRSAGRRRRHHAAVQRARGGPHARRRSPTSWSTRPSPTPRRPTRSPTRWSATSPATAWSPTAGRRASTASYSRMRVVVMVAVKNDLALVAGAVGPVPRIRPRLRVGQAVGGQPADRPGHGQVRQQLQLARRPAALTGHLVDDVTWISHG